MIDEWVSAEGPMGRLFAAYNRGGVSFVGVTEDPGDFTDRFMTRFDRPLRPADHPPRALVRSLETGQATRDLSFDLRGLSPFSQTVLSVTGRIPRGEVRSYSWVAQQAGRPAAVRAAGTALAHNPVPILVPCHRVVRHDGRLGNYGLGTDVKRGLLVAEGVDVEELESLWRTGARLLGSSATGIFCVPSCRAARHIGPTRRVAFASADDARAVGFRPCRLCRPTG